MVPAGQNPGVEQASQTLFDCLRVVLNNPTVEGHLDVLARTLLQLLAERAGLVGVVTAIDQIRGLRLLMGGVYLRATPNFGLRRRAKMGAYRRKQSQRTGTQCY